MKNIHFAKAGNTYENGGGGRGGGGGGVLGLFRGVINKVCGKQRGDGEPLIYWKWLASSLGRHNDSIMFKEIS